MNKAVFLDRDGTINVDSGYVHTPHEFSFLPGAVRGLKLLENAGYLLVVITNQSGIAKGFYKEEEYLIFQKWVERRLLKENIHIAKTYYCPHDSGDNCMCRKPGLLLFETAVKDFDISWSDSYVIGNNYRDIAVCGKYPVTGYLISHEKEDRMDGYKCVGSLLEAAEQIIHRERENEIAKKNHSHNCII